MKIAPISSTSIVQLFESVVEKHEKKIGLVDIECELSYREIAQRVNKVANYIVGLNLTAEKSMAKPCVGVCTSRNNNMIIAMLGVLKAGCIYVPIDPNYPKTRKQYLQSNAQCQLVITDTDQNENSFTVDTFNVNEIIQNKAISDLSSNSLYHNDTGFIIYTSGTTGEPKGALLTHSGLLNCVSALSDTLSIDSDSKVAHYAALSFDSATLEWLLALLNGATLVVVPECVRTEPKALSEFFKKFQVTQVLLPSAILPYLPLSQDYHFKALTVMGDVADINLLWQWSENYPAFNAYGPMEASVCTSIHKVEAGKKVTIGRPLKHINFLILDEHMEKVEPGVQGELYIGGVAISLGYVNSPTLNEESFVMLDDHRGDKKEAKKWYKTGDLVSLTEAGELEFCGRRDFQVKIRGNRIELSEVEAKLKKNDAVENAVVMVATGDHLHDKYLVAFVASQIKDDQYSAKLRDMLANELPQSHVPSQIIVMQELPLTVNLKIDRKALIDMLVKPSIASNSGGLPQQIKALFAKELRVSSIENDHDFFHAGGDSLAVIRLLNGLQSLLGNSMSMTEFRTNPTVNAVLAWLKNTDNEKRYEIALPKVGDGGRPEKFELSLQQLTAWYMFGQQADSKAYLAEAAIHFNGALDIKALEFSINTMFERHDIYRTVFFEEDGYPVQQVLPEFTLKLEQLNAYEVNPENKQQFIEKVLKENLTGVSDLSQLPLANFILISFSSTEHVLLHQEHHIIHDGWSGSEFTREMIDWYHSRVSAEYIFEPLPATQYSDFIFAQKQWLTTPQAQQQLNYWQGQLADSPQGVKLFGKKSNNLQFEGDHQKMVFTRAQWQACERVCQQLKMTPFAFTSAVLYLTMWRYSGETDLSFGSAFANRNWSNSHSALGMLVNTIVLRQKLDPQQSISEFLALTQQTIDQAQAHQEYPFTGIVEALNPDRSSDSNPFFNVLLGFHDTPLTTEEIPGLRWHKDETLLSATSKFDLDCLVVPRKDNFDKDEAVHFLWEYRSDVYEQGEISLFLASFQHAFLQLTNDFDTFSTLPLTKVETITPEQKQHLKQWGQGKSISDAVQQQFAGHDLVSAVTHIAITSPNKVAIAFESTKISYAELHSSTNRLANLLVQNQVKAGDRVAIYSQRNSALIIAMLAIFKVNACVVVIDESIPEGRAEFILKDTSPALVLFDKSVPAYISNHVTLQLAIAKGCDNALISDQFEIISPKSNALAYIIYTSGSTGVPKGVEIYHSSFLNDCFWHIDEFNLSDLTVGTNIAFAGFDAYMAEVWPLLMVGSTVLVIDDKSRDNLPILADLMEQYQVTHTCFSTGLFEATCASQFAWPASMKTLLVGGDKLGNVSLPDNVTAQCYNLYGPTENTIDATYFKLGLNKIDNPPIGRPIANVVTRVLADGQLAAIGVPGELYIGGAGVAKGYRNQPEQTQTKFVDMNPEIAEGRFYKTGDLVRWTSQGQIQFLGRIDDEVKIRGFRVDLGEITVRLQEDESVLQAAVAVKSSVLFAYVTITAEQKLQWQQGEGSERKFVRKTKSRLKKVLPEYMLPNAIMVLENMPLTPQGKVDRAQLPSPLENPKDFSVATTETEKKVSKIWQEVLEKPSISVSDNFFTIGGHSLLAMRIIALLRQTMAVELSMSDFFSYTSISELSRYIDAILSVRSELVQSMDKCAEEGEI